MVLGGRPHCNGLLSFTHYVFFFGIRANFSMFSGGFRPGPGRAGSTGPPVLLQPSPQFHGYPWFFYKNNTQIWFLCVFPPDPLTRPWTPLGALPQTPVIGSRYRARHEAVPHQILGARTATMLKAPARCTTDSHWLLGRDVWVTTVIT